MYEGATVDLRNGLDNVTMTAGMIQQGGVYLVPFGKSVNYS